MPNKWCHKRKRLNWQKEEKIYLRKDKKINSDFE